MMKKLKLTKILFLLLCAVMLLSSCGEETAENPDENIDVPAPPVIEEVNVSELISGVSGFLGYNGEQNNDALLSSSVLYDEAASESLYADLGYFVVVRLRSISIDAITGEPDMVTDRYTLKNVKNGKNLYSYQMPPYSYGSQSATTLEFKLYGDIIVEAALNEPVVAIGPDGLAYYEGVKTTYRYYNLDGAKLAEVPEENRATLTEFYDNGDLAFSVGNYTHIIRDEQIIYTFEVGQERYIPEIYHTQGGYHYVVSDIKSEIFVQILDANFICVAEYKLPAKVLDLLGSSSEDAVNNSVYILGDGNLLVQGFYAVKDGEEFDYYAGLNKYFVYTAHFDIETGVTTELDPGFIIKDLYSCESKYAPCTISPEYNLAEIVRFDKQTLSAEPALAVLDNKGEIVANMPEILPTQDLSIDSIKFIDETKFIFTTGVNNYSFVYLVDCKTQKMTLIANDANYMDGYFYTDRVIYSNSLELLHRLSDREEIVEEVGNGLIIRDGDEYKIFYVGAFGRALFVKIANSRNGDQIVAYGTDYVVVESAPTVDRPTTVFNVYNSRGEMVFTSDYEPEITGLGDGVYLAVATDEVVDMILGTTKTYRKALVLSCK